MAKSKLEKVLEYLINHEQDKARELLHTVIVEKARSIHESLMEQDETGKSARALNENEDDLAFEEFFGSEDLDGDDAEGDVDADAEGDESDTDAEKFAGDDADMGDDEAADDLEGDLDLGDDADMGDEGDADMDAAGDMGDADIEDLKNAIAELQAEFEKLQGGDAGDADMDADLDMGGDEADADADLDMGGDEAEGDDADADADLDMGGDDAEGDDAEGEEKDDDFFESLDALLSEDFADLTEGAVDDLEVVKACNKADLVGAKTGETGGFSTNDVSPIPQKPRDKRQGGEPVKIKGEQKSGYERETAPSSKEGTGAKSAKNIRKTATAGNSKVKKEGSAEAMLNKGEGFGEENRKSPLSSMGSKK